MNIPSLERLSLSLFRSVRKHIYSLMAHESRGESLDDFGKPFKTPMYRSPSQL